MTTTLEESIPACILELTVEHNDDSTTAASPCIFPPVFCGFEGHFPDNPILPAIVQLATVRKIAERIVEKSLLVKRCEKTKFRSMIRPNERVFFRLTLTRKEDIYHTKFNITDGDDKAIASGLCQYTVAE